MTMSSPCTSGHGRTIALGLACYALAACSGTAASPGPDAGSTAQTGSSSGSGVIDNGSSSSSGGTNQVLPSGSSSSSGGVDTSGSSSSGAIGLGSSSSSGGTGSGVASGSSSSGAVMSMNDSGSGGGGDEGGSGSGATSGDGGACPAGATFCDGFESGTMLGAAWTVDTSVKANTVTVVSTKAHSGSNSVYMTFTTASGATFIDEKMGIPATGTYWGRVWLYPETPVDQGHDVYIEAEPATFMGGTSQTGVRALNTQGNMSINVDPPDNGPKSNMALPRGSWHCFEWETTGIGGNGNVVLYMDGTLLATDTGAPIPALAEQRIGYERYGAGTAAGDMYIDDYAVGPTRLNCN